GYTDTVGNAKYNKALGELRALSVFERLVRAGLPPYRVVTESKGASAATSKGASAADRKVVVKWQTDAKIAAAAAVEDKKIVEAAPPPPPPAEAVAQPAPVVEVKEQAPAPVERKDSTFDLIPFVGSLAPTGDYADDAKAGVWYGLGIGKDFWTNGNSTVRGNLNVSATKFAAKDGSLSGDVKATDIAARFDYVFLLGAVNPFVGIGGGSLMWDGEIKQNVTELKNTGDKSDVHALIAAGLDIALVKNLSLEPTIEWNSVGGDFNANLLGLKLGLRWKI
ncbi:MAG: hypothetical protein EOP06_21135, partial [Proteobacteria bacterium]